MVQDAAPKTQSPNEQGRYAVDDQTGKPYLIRTVSPHLRQREPVDDRGHPVLADTEMQVLAARLLGLEAPA